MDLLQFISKFNDEIACEQYLKENLYTDGMYCSNCGCKKIYTIKTGTKYTNYKCSDCKQRFSVVTNTIFDKTRIPLQKWFLAIFLLTSNKKGISSVELSEKLSITQKTAWFLLHRIRECMNDNSMKLFGSVEMDETFIGGKEGNKHASKKQGYHGTEGKTAVMGAISREDKQVIAYPVKEVSYSTVETFREHNVAKESMIYSDECKAYQGQSHFKVNHSMKEFVRDGHIHTNTIESFWAIIKRGYIGIYHWWSIKHLKRYINEFTFRFNHKEQDIIQNISDRVMGKRLTYNKLIGSK